MRFFGRKAAEPEAAPKSEASTVVPSETASQEHVQTEAFTEKSTTNDATSVRSSQSKGESVPAIQAAAVELEKEQENDEIVYPSGMKLAIITVALCFSVFLVALDNTIIATAIPRITDHFGSLNDVGWYGSAYLLTTCALQYVGLSELFCAWLTEISQIVVW